MRSPSGTIHGSCNADNDVNDSSGCERQYFKLHDGNIDQSWQFLGVAAGHRNFELFRSRSEERITERQDYGAGCKHERYPRRLEQYGAGSKCI